MEALSGPVYLAGLLLALGGAAKAVRPVPTAGALRSLHLPGPRWGVRVLGALEVVLGLAAVLSGARFLLVAVGCFYVAFAIFVLVALRSGTALQTCGCFGSVDTPPSMIHVGLDAALAAACLASGTGGQPTARAFLADQPGAGIPMVLALAVGLYLAYLLLTALPTTLEAARVQSELRS
jgi:hypothetical protein